jgi:serine/threonine protein kinase
MNATISTTPSLLHGRYRIIERLGDSRLATVYHAEDERLKRAVLVHMLRADLMQQPRLHQRFTEEAQRGAQRSHPGLLEVYDSGEVDGRPYMVTEHVAGRPLAEVGALAVDEALNVLRTVADAVALTQAQRAPHPPISSRNVWLIPGGRVVLLENWLAAPQEIALDLAPYRAPEQRRGVAPSPASSIYALGILGWEVLVGRRPFHGATATEIGQQQLQAEPPLISQMRPTLFSPELDRIVARSIALDPQHRYPTPADFVHALDHYIAAANAPTGRLADLPQPTIETQPLRQSLLRWPLRQPEPAIAPPPPPPVIATPPQTLPARPPTADQHARKRQVQEAIRHKLRRWGCMRTLIKGSIWLIVAFLVLYGSYLGVRYAVDYAYGQAQQIDVREWISRQLPNINELLPWPDINEVIPSWLHTLSVDQPTYRVTQPINLRSEPSAASNATIIQVLAPGTRVQQQGPPQADPGGQPYQWIRVVVLDNGSEGWIALQNSRLERE